MLLVTTTLGAVAFVTSGAVVGPSPPPAASPALGPRQSATSYGRAIAVEPAARDAAVAPAAAPAAPLREAENCSDRTAQCELAGAGAEPKVTSQLRDSGCRVPGAHAPAGTTRIVPVVSPGNAGGKVLHYLVEIEDGLAVDDTCFASLIEAILDDPRGWGADGSISFQRVESQADFRVILASPETTDRLCYPLRTGGKYSCRSRAGVILNLLRWESGSEEHAGNLAAYREYLVNHEVGHVLGYGHVACPGPGQPAPVMMQQTKGLDGCLLNGWPTADER